MNIEVPEFNSLQDYQDALRQPRLWSRLLHEILQRHGLNLNQAHVQSGVGGTYPTFVMGDVVLKLFGYLPHWQEAYEAEKSALQAVAGNAAIKAPVLIAVGELHASQPQSWPYLMVSRVPGKPWHEAGLTDAEKQRVAEELGAQVARLQQLPLPRGQHESALPSTTAALIDAARRSSLPPHLVPQIEAYAARLANQSAHTEVLVHGDMMFRHVFVESGHLSGIIDWGDALVTDRHYELVQIQLNLFDRDAALWSAFLEAAQWPLAPDFARRCLLMALRRQAHGLVQHFSMDVFYKLPGWFDGTDGTYGRNVADLDALAEMLFGVGRV